MIKYVLEYEGKPHASAIADLLNYKAHITINYQVDRLGKRIVEQLLAVVFPRREDGEIRPWHILYLGEEDRQTGRFYWKLRPALENAAKIFFFDDIKKGQVPILPFTAEKIFEVIPAIRLLPMSQDDVEIGGKSIKDMQVWIEEKFPYRFYRFRNEVNTPTGTLMLFQYKGHVIASAVLENKNRYEGVFQDEYKGFYSFFSSSIAIFTPIKLEELQTVWGDIRSFNQSPQKLAVEHYPLFEELLSKRNFQYIKKKSEEEFQTEVEKLRVSSLVVEDTPKELTAKIYNNARRQKWGRDPLTSKRAITLAGNTCEIDETHHYFTSSTTGKNYVEAHHLIPMEFQLQFGNSLDVEANIISLCPMCHKKVHHAITDEKLPVVEELYEKRKNRLEKCGIGVSLEKLKSYY